jgi:uncharacterized protein YaaN involved in tellurite resistance
VKSERGGTDWGSQSAQDGRVRRIVDRMRARHVEFSAIMGDSEYAAKDDLQSTRDVVYEHAQKLDELSRKIDDLSKRLDELNPQDVVKDWSGLYKLLDDNSNSFGDAVMRTSSVQSKFNDISSTLDQIKSKLGM